MKTNFSCSPADRPCATFCWPYSTIPTISPTRPLHKSSFLHGLSLPSPNYLASSTGQRVPARSQAQPSHATMASKTASAFQVHSAPPAGYQHGPASPQDAWNHMQDRSGVRGTASHQQPVQQPAQQQQQRQPYNQQPPMAYQSLVQQPRPIPSEWQEGYCECFSPLSLGLKAGCCPCVVYGKTHHRLRNDGDMSQYDCCNVSVCRACLLQLIPS